MLSNIVNNMYQLLLSMPVNIAILVVICILLKIFAKYTFKDCIKVIIGYLLVCVLLGFFGITMPSFITVFNWLKELAIKVWTAIW